MDNTDTSQDLDLTHFLKIIFDNKKLILFFTSLGLVISIIIAIVRKNEYTAYTSLLLLEGNANSGGAGLSGLASLAGINLNSGSSSSIPLSIYPKIVNGIDFKSKLVKTPLTAFEEGDLNTYRQWYAEQHSLTFSEEEVKNVLVSFNSETDTLMNLSRDEIDFLNSLDKSLNINTNVKDGLIELSFVSTDPIVSSIMLKSAQYLLLAELEALKQRRSRKELDFVNERFREKKNEFVKIQRELSILKDRNNNISTAQARNELDLLETNYELAFNVYNELAKQVETAKIDVQRNTPSIQIIEDVTIPNRKSGPKRSVILILGLLIGSFTGVFLVVLYDLYLKLRSSI